MSYSYQRTKRQIFPWNCSCSPMFPEPSTSMEIWWNYFSENKKGNFSFKFQEMFLLCPLQLINLDMLSFEFWISNICCCFLQAIAVEKVKTNIQKSTWPNRCAAKDISPRLESIRDVHPVPLIIMAIPVVEFSRKRYKIR